MLRLERPAGAKPALAQTGLQGNRCPGGLLLQQAGAWGLVAAMQHSRQRAMAHCAGKVVGWGKLICHLQGVPKALCAVIGVFCVLQIGKSGYGWLSSFTYRQRPSLQSETLKSKSSWLLILFSLYSGGNLYPVMKLFLSLCHRYRTLAIC